MWPLDNVFSKNTLGTEMKESDSQTCESHAEKRAGVSTVGETCKSLKGKNNLKHLSVGPPGAMGTS